MDEITPEQARATIQAATKARLEACQREINEILEKYQCRLVAQPGITQDGRIAANIALAPAAET
jgi:hypothetical protein